MKAIETKGRDGSPQPSEYATSTRAPQRSAPTYFSLRVSAPPREFSLRSRSAFTLLEVLVATAVLALMLSFLFNLLGSSSKLWEIGNKKIEAAQAARVGLNIMSNDLKNAFAGNMTSYSSNGTSIQNIAPFVAIESPTNAIDIPAVGNAENANGSAQLFGVISSGDTTEPFKEFGYLCVYIGNKDGTNPMAGYRYYLVRKLANGSSNNGDFFLKASDSAWASTSTAFSPIIDNCIRMKLEYYGNTTSAIGAPDWTTNWTPTDRLPLGVLVTLSVLDSKTAIKIAAVSNNSALSDADITAGIKAASGNGSTSNDIQRLISQGVVTMSRFIPLNPN